MYKWMFIPLMIQIISGCVNTDELDKPDLKKYYDYPIYCPSNYVEYCEGTNQQNMECQCIERRQQRQLFEQLMRTNGIA